MGCPSGTVPYCILTKISWGVLQALKVPEDRAHLYVGTHGWKVLIRDSEMPLPLPDGLDLRAVRSNPRRVPDPPLSNGEEA